MLRGMTALSTSPFAELKLIAVVFPAFGASNNQFFRTPEARNSQLTRAGLLLPVLVRASYAAQTAGAGGRWSLPCRTQGRAGEARLI